MKGPILSKEPNTTKLQQFVHYFVLEPEGNKSPEVFESPFPMPAAVALHKINDQANNNGERQFIGKILRVTYDLVGRRFYLPEVNTESISKGKLQAMYDAARIRIQNKYGDKYPFGAGGPIFAEPTESIRVKKVSNYPSAWSFIRKAFGEREIQDLPVIEANLEIMPRTAAALRNIVGDRKGGFVGETSGWDTVPFLSVNSDKTESLIFNQSVPFILIDTSPEKKTTYNDREITIISSFKKALDEKESGNTNVGALSGSEFYALEVMMYQGWSLDEICESMISVDSVASAQDAMSRGAHILLAAEGISKAGFRNPADRPYYYAYNFDKKFPTNLDSSLFYIANLDYEKNWAVVRSPLFLDDDILRMHFGAKGEIYRGKMDPQLETFCTNTDITQLKRNSPTSYWTIVGNVKKGENIYGEDLDFKITTSAEESFKRQRISMYPQAEQVLTSICDKYKVPFDDIEVIVGPWKQTGWQLEAAYLDKERVIRSGHKLPVEPVPGLKLNPPFILIDSTSYPAPPDRTSLIIHEYQHYLNLKLGLVGYEVDYNIKEIQGDTKKFITSYLGSKDENLAHISQMRYLLAGGMSKEEVVKLFASRDIRNLTDVALMAKYNELASAAEEQLEMADLVGPTEEDLDVKETEYQQATPGKSQMGHP